MIGLIRSSWLILLFPFGNCRIRWSWIRRSCGWTPRGAFSNGLLKLKRGSMSHQTLPLSQRTNFAPLFRLIICLTKPSSPTLLAERGLVFWGKAGENAKGLEDDVGVVRINLEGAVKPSLHGSASFPCGTAGEFLIHTLADCR